MFPGKILQNLAELQSSPNILYLQKANSSSSYLVQPQCVTYIRSKAYLMGGEEKEKTEMHKEIYLVMYYPAGIVICYISFMLPQLQD